MDGQWHELRGRMLDRRRRSLFRITITISLVVAGIALGIVLATVPLWP